MDRIEFYNRYFDGEKVYTCWGKLCVLATQE